MFSVELQLLSLGSLLEVGVVWAVLWILECSPVDFVVSLSVELVSLSGVVPCAWFVVGVVLGRFNCPSVAVMLLVEMQLVSSAFLLEVVMCA